MSLPLHRFCRSHCPSLEKKNLRASFQSSHHIRFTRNLFTKNRRNTSIHEKHRNTYIYKKYWNTSTCKEDRNTYICSHNIVEYIHANYFRRAVPTASQSLALHVPPLALELQHERLARPAKVPKLYMKSTNLNQKIPNLNT